VDSERGGLRRPPARAASSLLLSSISPKVWKPSLWTAQPIGSLGAAVPDGFHTFGEIEERSNELAARAGGRRKPPRSESTPHLHANGTSDYPPKPNHDLATLQPPLPTAGVGPHAGTHGKLRKETNGGGMNLSKLSPLARTK
jgi:hypothetical protein